MVFATVSITAVILVAVVAVRLAAVAVIPLIVADFVRLVHKGMQAGEPVIEILSLTPVEIPIIAAIIIQSLAQIANRPITLPRLPATERSVTQAVLNTLIGVLELAAEVVVATLIAVPIVTSVVLIRAVLDSAFVAVFSGACGGRNCNSNDSYREEGGQMSFHDYLHSFALPMLS